LNHQKIDKPSQSKFPSFANVREDSRIFPVGKDQGKDQVEEGKGKEEKKPSAAFALPDWVDRSNWDLWIKTRKGKKMLPEQMQAQVEKLRKWKDAGLPYAQSLADSASNGWQGLFEPKTAGQKRAASPENFNDRDYGEGVTKL
jgi:hypothetical protein